MALWLVRAGRRGEHEQRFLDDGRIYLTWGNTFRSHDPTGCKSYDDVRAMVDNLIPGLSKHRRGHSAGQFAAFLVFMKPGDWVAMPHKHKAAIAIGEITGPVSYNTKETDLYRVSRTVRWIDAEVPRSAFDQDILYSLGAFMTICEVKRNNAEQRVRALVRDGKKAATSPKESPQPESEPSEDDAPQDLARLSRDAIAARIRAKFKGHGMATLVDAVLRAQGYTTHKSPEGPDGGVDILAAPGTLGFGSPRLCVQVKSGDGPIDRPTLDQLIGAMQNFHAEQGLLVSWGGFRSSVDRVRADQFFRVRLWDSDDLVDALLDNYEKLPEELRAELPLQRIWTLVPDDELD